MRKLLFLSIVLALVGCNRGRNDANEVVQTRTSGSVELLVDESFASVVSDQIEVFKSDYKDANFKVIQGHENKIVPVFLNDSVRVIVLSRMLTHEEDKIYRSRSIVPKTSRFAIDGIALITNVDNIDSNINVEEVIEIMKGSSSVRRGLVFDNAYSSTLRYFKGLAKVKDLPAKGIYTLQTNNDVIKYVAENKGYIGVIGVNWLIANSSNMSKFISRVKMMGVKDLPGKKGAGAYYKPIQRNLINGIYPFLRNVYIINAEGRDGLGTGFANWVMSPRGQLIVLRSGLGPHKMMPREFNLKNTK
jgi:phosphate transport system substrate-binding protein